MNRTLKLNRDRPPLSTALFLAACVAAVGGQLWPAAPAQAAERGSQYCDAERGNACNDHESSNPSPSPRSGPVTDPATPTDPDPPAEPEPTPETPT